MATMITINVTNATPMLQDFFFFQQPAKYSGSAPVYTNSLYTEALPSNMVLSFTMMLQYYARVQQQVPQPTIGQAASQAIGLTPAPGGTPTANTTHMSVSPSLELSAPVSTIGPRPGSFRIVTPDYDPGLAAYNAGSALPALQGGTTLSNFVTAQPNSNIDCQPVMVFYVQTGIYAPGTVIDFATSSLYAVACDATSGSTTFNVTYNADGTWTVQPSMT